MSVNRLRIDSVKALSQKKTPEQLAMENEQLRGKVSALESQLEDTQMALCDVYELLVGGEQ